MSILSVDVEGAIAFVKEHGDGWSQLRLAILRGLSVKELGAMALAQRQNADGGWLSQDASGDFSGVSDTVEMLWSVAELGLGETKLAEKAIHFLLAAQKDDGHWDEPLELADATPPAWLTPGDLNVQIWETANVICCLLGLGYDVQETPIQRAAQFLRGHIDPQGKARGYPHATFLCAAAFWAIDGPDSELAANGLHLFGRAVDASWKPWEVIWASNAFYAVRIPREQATVQRTLEVLACLQEDDGRWPSSYGSDVTDTVGALSVLHRYQVIELSPPDLDLKAEPH